MTINVDLVTIDYLKDLTGKKRRKDMIEWLNEKGYCFEVGADGYPKVTKSFINKRLGGGDDSHFDAAKRKRGNRQALKEAMGIS